MPSFIDFAIRTIPLYLYIFLGFFSANFLKLEAKSFTKFLIYIVLPIISFNAGLSAKLDLGVLILPFLILIFCIVIAFIAYYLAGFIWKDETANLISYASGFGNFGFYAIPVGVILFGVSIEPLIVIAGLGMQVFQDTIGYFILVKGKFDFKESFLKVAKLPSIYFLIIAFILNLLNLNSFVQNSNYISILANFRSVFIIFGMMIIGMSVDFKNMEIDWKMVSFGFFFKFLVWPLVVIVFVILIKPTGLLSLDILKVILLTGGIPFGSLLVAYSANLNIKPKKAATLVLLSLIFALLYMPIYISIALQTIN
jgi:predicted permease